MSSSGRRIRIQGTVQGVGFRPWVFRLARESGVAGSVRNDAAGVTIEAFGSPRELEDFLGLLRGSPPPAAAIRRFECQEIGVHPVEGFEIVHSVAGSERQVSIPPDLATCDDCGDDVSRESNRRHRYPFTNCTNCGPRFSITLDLPYDRPATTMAGFEMCSDCRREYEDPLDRRFHAQPNACPVCGPQVWLATASGEVLARRHEALEEAAREVEEGRILAVKGLGGFHLMVDARSDEAVVRLRDRKARFDKPLALMVGGVAAAGALCEVPDEAADLLRSPQAPIVLLERLPGAEVAAEVAPGNPYLGVMIPYTPLHRLLMAEIGFPVVATSGNLSDEPICIDNEEAMERLGDIADLFLLHDRPIERHADDSVAWLPEGAPALLRRARGYAPAPVALDSAAPTLLAVGGHLKNTVAVNLDRNVFVSQHIGDMETPQAFEAFERVIGDLIRMCEAEPVAVVHDLHPDYPSTRWARQAVAGEGPLAGLPLVAIQHHHAHLAACLAENASDGPALGVSWDGTGYGLDGTIWGGEFLVGDGLAFYRAARLRPFRLPGGEAAIKEPRRTALALLWELWGEAVWERGAGLGVLESFSAGERRVFSRMLESGTGSPATTSAGRLFDGVAALAGLRQRVSFEGHAAMDLEFAAAGRLAEPYEMALKEVELPVVEAVWGSGGEDGGTVPVLELDWRGLVASVVQDARRGAGADMIAARFHAGLVESIVRLAEEVGETRVALSGGCFQNRLLTEGAARRLRSAGHEVLLHRRVPANDGGISLGQLAAAAARLANQQGSPVGSRD